MAWDSIIGQERVKRTLISGLRTGRLPHAYLMYGAEGVGKDAMALEFARVLHCREGGLEACGKCDSCHAIDSLQHPDVRFIVPLPVGRGEQSGDDPMAKLTDPETKMVQDALRAKAENPYSRVSIPRATIIKMSSVREIRRESALSAFDRRKRVFILSPADAMGAEASNTLLKTLEEPPGDCILILNTARREALLPTIISRCQSIRFDSLTEAEIRSALMERNGEPDTTASFLARLANGSYTRALDLLNAETMDERVHALTFIRHVLGTSVKRILQDIERLTEPKDRDFVERFLLLLLTWFRDALVLSHGGIVVNVDQNEELQRFITRFPSADLPRVIADVEKAIFLINRNVYIKVTILQLAVRLKRSIMHTV